MENKKVRPNGKALIPFLIFVLFYLGVGLYLNYKEVPMAFYVVPAPISVLVGIIFAFIMFKGSIDSKFSNFVKGCGDENIIIMCIIYILAGAFATVSGAMGGVESTVNLGMSIIPPQLLTAGIFLMAALISLATGTSVGTITTMCPIAVGLATQGGLSMPLTIGALVGGSMFGDNLSVISDTTIAATRTQNVEMRDKFKMNFKLALPAAIITFVLLLIFGKPEVVTQGGPYEYSFVKVIPYIVVLVSALLGFNVFLVLTSGILLSGIIGIATHSFTLLELPGHIYTGFSGVFEIFLLSMLTGGLAYMVRNEGGIEWIIQKTKKFLKGPKSAEVGTAVLISALDAAVANNTVAIIIAGPVAKEFSNEYKMDPRRSASLLDTFSCVMQGFIPYGAQLLIAAKLTEGAVSTFQIMPFLWYQFILAIVAIISVYIPFTEPKDKWNYEYDMPQSKAKEFIDKGIAPKDAKLA
ncbi:Na+/H+ antiporter NhaC family protein [Peptoniphilus sp. BV3AC2]|uniref:Na+/H+ antiporter NhaC family protein n=1 Tax=Peptoniphilus sp. BV3AC2 TaxID=1111133 RepID=UPI0003B807CF|nr:Na+/H+ antiporter NhaC family protein [Peptoniphilus sp. BV3AC2]ERT64738.1 Na+/H+ antiporter family protein [Peptoniphilus sp. BV3AC2]